MNGTILKERLKLQISDEVLNKALMHSSYINTSNDLDSILYANNKIKSDLGASLLSIIAKTYYLMETNKTVDEINSCISTVKMAEEFYKKYELNDLIYLSKGEKQTNHTIYIEQAYIIIYEIFYNLGITVIYNLLKELIKRSEVVDYKTLLQEYTQSFKAAPKYEVISSTTGINPFFKVKVFALGKEGFGEERSKKVAEKLAAENYIKMNNIKLNKNEVSGVRKPENWSVDSERKTEIDNLRKVVLHNSNIIPEYILDRCFIHKSYTKNNNRRINVNSNEKFIFLGADILELYVGLVMYNTDINRYLDNPKLFVLDKGVLLNENNLKSNFLENYSEDILHYIKILNYNENKSNLAPGIFKAILGGVFYYNFFNNVKMMVEVHKFLYQFVEESNLVCTDKNDYTNWLHDLKQQLGIEVYLFDYTESGPPNKRKFSEGIRFKLSEYNLEDIVVKAEDYSKLKLQAKLAKLAFQKLKTTFNIEDENKLPNKETINLFLRDLINYCIIKNSFYPIKIDILGEFMGETWNDALIQAAMDNLCNRGLFKELNNVLQQLIKLHGKEKVANIRFNKEILNFISTVTTADNLRETNTDDNSISKNILLDRERVFDEQVSLNKKLFYRIKAKNLNIKTKLYNLKEEVCPYCNNTLQQLEDVVLVKNNETCLPLISDISFCPICNIYGTTKEQYMQIYETGFLVEFYDGSPAYFTSSIIPVKSLEVYLFNKLKDKGFKRKGTSPEELEKQLTTMKKIGLEGECIIFDYEKRLLKEMGREDLAQMVDWAAKRDCTLGYDILSYDIHGNEKYIEVKSSIGNSDKFYLSQNEIEIAKSYGDQYYIYKVNNLRSMPYINKIKNPIMRIERGELVAKPSQFSVKLL